VKNSKQISIPLSGSLLLHTLDFFIKNGSFTIVFLGLGKSSKKRGHIRPWPMGIGQPQQSSQSTSQSFGGHIRP